MILLNDKFKDDLERFKLSEKFDFYYLTILNELNLKPYNCITDESFNKLNLYYTLLKESYWN